MNESSAIGPNHGDIQFFRVKIVCPNVVGLSVQKIELDGQHQQYWLRVVCATITFIGAVVSAYFVAQGVESGDNVIWGSASAGLAVSGVLFFLSLWAIQTVNQSIKTKTDEKNQALAAEKCALEKPIPMPEFLGYLKTQSSQKYKQYLKWSMPILQEIGPGTVKPWDEKDKELFLYYFNKLENDTLKQPVMVELINKFDQKFLIEIFDQSANNLDRQEAILSCLEKNKRHEFLYEKALKSGCLLHISTLTKLNALSAFVNFLVSKDDDNKEKRHDWVLHCMAWSGKMIMNSQEFNLLTLKEWAQAYERGEQQVAASFVSILSNDQSLEFLMEFKGEERLCRDIKKNFDDLNNIARKRLVDKVIAIAKGENDPRSAKKEGCKYALGALLLAVHPSAQWFDFANDPEARELLTPDQWQKVINKFRGNEVVLNQFKAMLNPEALAFFKLS